MLELLDPLEMLCLLVVGFEVGELLLEVGYLLILLLELLLEQLHLG